MEPILFRLLVGCLVLWLIDKGLTVFRVGDPPRWIIELVAFILVVLWILLGWMLEPYL